MGIEHCDPPAEGLELVRAHLGDVIDNTPGYMHGPVGNLESIKLSPAHPGYDYQADDLAEADPALDKAELHTWNYFVYRGEPPHDDFEVLGIAHLLVLDEELVFHGMTSGPLVDAKIAAIFRAEEDRRAQEMHYELRTFLIAQLKFAALWFHRDKNEAEGETESSFFIPVYVHPDHDLEIMKDCSWADIVKALRPHAIEAVGLPHLVPPSRR